MSRIGLIIRYMRERRGWNQTELAKRAGLKRSALGNYESGARSPGLDILEQLADAFGVSLGDMVNGVELQESVTSARQDLFDDPNRKALLDFARHGSPEAVRQAAAVIDALRATNPEYYDGDDPA